MTSPGDTVREAPRARDDARHERPERRWAFTLALVVVALVLLVSGWVYVMVPSRQTATALIRVADQKPFILFENRVPPEDARRFRNSQRALIKSRRVLGSVLAQPNVAKLPLVRRNGNSLDWLLDQIVVEAPEGTDLMTVSMSGYAGDAKDLEAVVNAVVDSYMKNVVDEDDRANFDRLEKLKLVRDQYQEICHGKRSTVRQMERKVGEGLDLHNEQMEIELVQEMAKKVGRAVEELQVEFGAPRRVVLIDKAHCPTGKSGNPGPSGPSTLLERLIPASWLQ